MCVIYYITQIYVVYYIIRYISDDANLTLTNGATALPSNNIGSLVNLTGHQAMVSQTVASAVPTAGTTSHPLIGNELLNVN